GTPQVVAQAQTPKPSRSASGADGAPMTWLLLSISWISSDDLRPAGAPLTVPESNAMFDRFGSGARPTVVPISSGASSIHCAVACVDVYGTVVVNVSFRVTS